MTLDRVRLLILAAAGALALSIGVLVVVVANRKAAPPVVESSAAAGVETAPAPDPDDEAGAAREPDAPPERAGEPTPGTDVGGARSPFVDHKLEPQGVYAEIDVKRLNETIDLMLAEPSRKQSERIRDIEAHPERYAPPAFYALSFALHRASRHEDAAVWFYFGQVRARYDANRCKDLSARSGVGILNQTYGRPTNRWAMKSADRFERIVERALELDRSTPHDYDHRWLNLHGLGSTLASLTESKVDPAALSLPESEWPTILEQTRTTYTEGFREAVHKLRELGR